MYDPGLSPDGFRSLLEVMCTGYVRDIRVSSMDMKTGTVIGDISRMMIDGQVNISSSSDVSRSASLSIYDPYGDIGVETTNPHEGAYYYSRMVKIHYGIRRPLDPADKTVYIPIFTGPINSLSRAGKFVQIECIGKESLAKHSFWRPQAWPVGTYHWWVVQEIMKQRSGESRFMLDQIASRISSALYYPDRANVWQAAVDVASWGGYQLFYDGDGRLRLRKYPETPDFEFRDGLGGSILSEPKWSYNDEEFRNAVHVVGAVLAGRGPIATASVLPAEHPLSPWSLGRVVDGVLVPRYYAEFIDDSDIPTYAQAQRLGDQSLARYVEQQSKVDFDILPIPLLEESDLVGINMSGKYNVTTRVTDMSIPLVGGTATFGSNKNLSIKKRV